MAELRGRVCWGSNNIFYVEDLDQPGLRVECRIKGKQLVVADEYNVLVPGDLVIYDHQTSGSSIVKRLDRSNVFSRWNKKASCPQAFAANLDQVFCVCSPNSPPFRPRFLDRCLVAADQAGIEMIILLNKIDQPLLLEDTERLADYRQLGYRLIETSAETGQGLVELAAILATKTSLFMGQSGVGKSSLLNRLVDKAAASVGEVSSKFNRGRHTTVLSKLYGLAGGGSVIDTPGVREFEPANIDPQNLPFLYREIAPLVPLCGRYNCSHTQEPDCAVYQAALNGQIHADRYESYLRLREAICEQAAAKR